MQLASVRERGRRWRLLGPSGGLPRLRGQDRETLRLAVPAFGALVAEPLFLLADSAIVGRIGTVPLGGLGVASQALTTLFNISIFLAYGTTAVVSRQLGAGRRKEAIRQGIDGLWMATGIGLAVIVLAWPLAPEIVRVFGASPAVSQGAMTYLRISVLGAPSMLLVLAGTGVLRGLQDTRTTLLVAVAANAVNIALNATFVLGLRLGRAGSAWGTVIAQTAAAAAYFVVVARGARRAGVGLGMDLAGLRSAATAAAGLILRTLALQAVLVVTTAVAARQGDAAIAAHQVAFRLWNLLALALDAIAIAAQAITGRYLGAGDAAGARAATTRMIWWGAVYGVAFGLALLLARPLLPGLFAAAPRRLHRRRHRRQADPVQRGGPRPGRRGAGGQRRDPGRRRHDPPGQSGAAWAVTIPQQPPDRARAAAEPGPGHAHGQRRPRRVGAVLHRWRGGPAR